MGSNRLLSSSIHGHISGQASIGYTCIEKYEWKYLTFIQNGRTGREQSRHVGTMNCPRHVSSRTGEYTAFHNHGGSSEIHDPGNGGGPCLRSCCSYNSYHGQDHACFRHPSKRARRSISPGPGPTRSDRSKQCLSFDGAHHYAKGAERQRNQALTFRENFPVNQGYSSQNRHQQGNKYILSEVNLPDTEFSEIDAAKHRSYMRSFHASKKPEDYSREDPRTSNGLPFRKDEELSTRTEKPVDKFGDIYSEQSLSPSNIHECSGSRSKFRNAFNGRILKIKCKKQKLIKQGPHKNTYIGSRASNHGTNSNNWKRNTNQLARKKAWRNVVSEDKSGTFYRPNQQDHELQVESNNMRNGTREGNTETAKLVGLNEAKGSCNLEKNTSASPVSSISTKCEEELNMVSPNYSSKTVASLSGTRRSNTEPESDSQSNFDGCIKRGIQQHLPATHTAKGAHQKESSHSEVLRDCLNIWRRLRKRRGAEADKSINTDQQQTVKTTRVSIGGRVKNVGAAVCSSISESDHKDDSALESSELSSTEISSERLRKSGERRVDRKLESPLQCPSSHKCKTSPQNTTAEKLSPETKFGENTQQKEQVHSSTDHPDAKMQTTRYGFADTSKLNQAAVSHHDNSAHQDVLQVADNDSLGEKRKDKVALICEIKKEGKGGDAQLAVLDEKNVTCWSMHKKMKVYTSKFLNHDSGSTTINTSIVDKGTATKCQKKPSNQSGGNYCTYIMDRSNLYGDIQQETMVCKKLGKKQDSSVLVDSENGMSHKAANEDCQAPQTPGFGITSNHQTSQQGDSVIVNSCSANKGDRAPCFLVPDLNCLPSMVDDEDILASEEPVCQANADGLKPQSLSESISASLTGPVMEERLKQVEADQVGKEVCMKETSELANQLQISDSNTGPPELSTAEENSTSREAFRRALCEFMRNILMPLYEDGRLSRDVYKIIMNKAAAKVIGTLGPKVPSTKEEISTFISTPDESRNLEKLVHGYLDIYVGKVVLKGTILGSS